MQNAAPSLTLLYSPFGTLDEARKVARQLVSEKLVACCNIIPSLESHYCWEGALTQTNEVLLLAKTLPFQAEAAAARLAALHPYRCPAILRLAAEANPLFAQWVGESVKL